MSCMLDTDVLKLCPACDLARLFDIDRPMAKRLVCRWRRGEDGRLESHWEIDLAERAPWSELKR